MSCNTAQLSNPNISIKPSQELEEYIKTIKITNNVVPVGIGSIIFKNPVAKSDLKTKKLDYLITSEDKEFLESIVIDSKENNCTKLPSTNTGSKLLNLQDLHWLYYYIQKENKENEKKVYLHKLLEGSEIILPKNEEIPRNAELDLRCRKLKAQQENKNYMNMTKDVDRTRQNHPEDTIGYQMRQLNKHIVAIFQFIISVAAGFAFGFVGIELITDNLDFGFRLLLGIICALTIALAELYFLAKKLNEDLQFENYVQQQQKNVKVD